MGITNFDSYSDEEFKNLIKYKYKDEFTFSNDFKNRVLKIKNILTYQQVILYIEEKNSAFADKIDDEKNKQLDNLIENYKRKNIDLFKDNTLIDIKDIICYRFFKDNYNNVLLNCKEMLSFIESSKKETIKQDNMDIYKKIIMIDNMTTEQLIDIYGYLLKIEEILKDVSKDKNIIQLFYDDYRKCLDESHQLLCESLTDFNMDNNSKLTSDGRFAIHELKGQSFGILITCGSLEPFFEKADSREEEKNEGINAWLSVGGRFNDTATSLSYLNENFIKSNWSGTIIGFKKDNINPNQIVATNPYDLDASSSGFNQVKFNYTNVITTPENLSRRTAQGGHNEVLYKCKSNDVAYAENELNQSLEPLIPSYIICYNKVNQEELDIAKKIEENFGVKLEFIVIYEHYYENSLHYETDEEKKRRESKYILREY